MSEQLIIDFFRSACYGSAKTRKLTEAQFRAVRVFIVTADLRELRQWYASGQNLATAN